MKVLIATDKPFAPVAVNGIREVVEKAGYELVLLEGYTDSSQLLEAVADVDAMIIRSDKATKEVMEASKILKLLSVLVLVTITLIYPQQQKKV